MHDRRTFNDLRHGESEKSFTIRSDEFLDYLERDHVPDLLESRPTGQFDSSVVHFYHVFKRIELVGGLVEQRLQLRHQHLNDRLERICQKIRHLYVTEALISWHIYVQAHQWQSTLCFRVC